MYEGAGRAIGAKTPDSTVASPEVTGGDTPFFISRMTSAISSYAKQFAQWLVPEEENKRATPVEASSETAPPQHITDVASADRSHHTVLSSAPKFEEQTATLVRANGGSSMIVVSPTDDGQLLAGPKGGLKPVETRTPTIDFGNPLTLSLVGITKPVGDQKNIKELIGAPINFLGMENVSFVLGKNFEDPGDPKLVNQDSPGVAEAVQTSKDMHNMLQGVRIADKLKGMVPDTKAEQKASLSTPNLGGSKETLIS